MQLVGSGFAGDSKLVVGFSVLALHKQSESKTIYTERWQVLDLIEYIYHLYTSGNVMLDFSPQVSINDSFPINWL